MNYNIFYSWQSDLESRFNRSFIQDALEKAGKKISKDQSFSINPIIDRDTYGILGSPSIVESITSKISKADIFVCDISIINSTSDDRHCPNPNVLFELGYASAILGWDRIIMVMNSAYGGVERLPFDLRGRRVLLYEANRKTAQKTEEKSHLKQKLSDTFLHVFRNYSRVSLDIKEKIVWWGEWHLDTKVKAKGGSIRISRVSSDAFFFELTLYDGARTGEITGKAKITTPHSAYCRLKSFEEEECEVNFRRRLEGNKWCIDVETGIPCRSFHGMNSSFEGTYVHNTESVINWGYLDEIDINEISRITGDYLRTLMNNFQQIFNEEENSEDFKVVTGGVKGLYNTMESIVVLDNHGGVWCACLDPEEDLVRYFTNVNSDDKPSVIGEWLSRFSDRKIIINQTIRNINYTRVDY